MTPSSHSEMVAVTRADREAAAAAIGPGYSLDRATIEVGAADGHRIVQAFARHRIAVLESLIPPNEEMIEAAHDRLADDGDVADIFTAMITAALKGAA
jgi:hypothetical protein